VIVVQANLKLLFSDNVLLGPILVVFPNIQSARFEPGQKKALLDDLARLYYPLDLLHDKRSNPHCKKNASTPRISRETK